MTGLEWRWASKMSNSKDPRSEPFDEVWSGYRFPFGLLWEMAAIYGREFSSVPNPCFVFLRRTVKL